MRFAPQFLDEIRDRVPISSLIGTRVAFDRKKSVPSRGDFWACCPFHGEKTPSFHCEDRKGRYHCFGCGASGDHFNFLIELEGLSFPEAVERIADMAGVALPEKDPEAEKRQAIRSTLYDVMELACSYYEEQLQTSAGAKARAYLRDRGLSGNTQRMFRIGFAPDGRNHLKEYLASKGVGLEQMEACGLIVSGADIPVAYDRFRDRIMFPIEDLRGRIIAFGGRAMSADARAKYLNSPETELFHKGRILYNAMRARKLSQAQAGEEAKPVIVVEGYMDVIALAQAGIGQAVAPLGTALTEDQIQLLWRMHPEPILCFDGDQAGLRAANRAVDLALPILRSGQSLRFALLPEGQDPDDVIKNGGVAAMRDVLAQGQALADRLWNRETLGAVFDTPEKKAELDNRLREITSKIADENIRRYYQQDMRERARNFFTPQRPQRGNFYQQRNGGNRFNNQRGAAQLSVSDSLIRSSLVAGGRPGAGTPPLRETAILMTLINHPQLFEEDFEAMASLELEHESVKRLHLAVLDVLAAGKIEDGIAMRQALINAGYGEILEQLDGVVRRARLWTAMPKAAENDARDALKQAVHLHQRATTLHKELRAVEAALANDETGEAFNRLLEIQNELRQTDATEALIDGFGLSSGRPAGGF